MVNKEVEYIKYKEVLLALKKKHKKLTNKIVLKEASKKTSILHKAFDWDDTSAGEKWRLHMATVLINQTTECVVYKDKTIRQRVFYGVSDNTGKCHYVTKQEVLKSNKYQAELLEKCINHMENTTMLLKTLKGEL